jgi:tetratricopeptide (TPR) repeat protein
MVLLQFRGLINFVEKLWNGFNKERMEINEAVKLFEKNEFEKSVEILNELISMNSADIQSLNLRGRIYYKMQKWGSAMNDYAAVLEIEPNNQEAKTGFQMAKNILGYFTPDMFNP